MIAAADSTVRPSKSRKKRLTYEDYVRLTPPDSGNYELHDGQIIHMPSPTPHHQDITGEIYFHMKQFAKANNLGKAFIAPLDTMFDRFNTLQPDVLFISKDRLEIVGQKKIEAAPDLVVEVLSGGNTKKEMLHKKYIYESFEVKEYWLINLEKETITQYLLKDEEFVSQVFSFDDEVTSEALSGFKLQLRNILA